MKRNGPVLLTLPGVQNPADVVIVAPGAVAGVTPSSVGSRIILHGGERLYTRLRTYQVAQVLAKVKARRGSDPILADRVASARVGANGKVTLVLDPDERAEVVRSLC